MSREEWQELRKQAEDAGYDGANGWGKEALEDFLTAPSDGKAEDVSADMSAPEFDDAEAAKGQPVDMIPPEAKAAGAIFDGLKKIDDPMFSKKVLLEGLIEELRDAAINLRDLKTARATQWKGMSTETNHNEFSAMKAKYAELQEKIKTAERAWKRLRNKVDVTRAQIEVFESV
jgi:hypothetical protein